MREAVGTTSVGGGWQATSVRYRGRRTTVAVGAQGQRQSGGRSARQGPIDIREGLVMYTAGAQPTLVVDRMSSARRLTDDEFRAWAQTQTVFISSVMGELATERRFLASMIAELGATPVLFRILGAVIRGRRRRICRASPAATST
jgi:hypothetical protein